VPPESELTEVQNWARFPQSRSEIIPIKSVDQDICFDRQGRSFLPFGMGRSLGDSCLNDGNTLLTTPALNRVISFDEGSGRLVAEAGITFDAILRLAMPHGWFLPVTPGTRFVSLGGAIANDVHGKNHHAVGTFGRHVIRFQLRRSDGSRRICSAEENPEWFRATIAGLGLTGLIEWAEVQLKPIINSWIDSETIRYRDLDEFYALNEASEQDHEYLVAWADSLATRPLGRGLFMRGNHNQDPKRARIPLGGTKITVPMVMPFSLLNQLTLTMFNAAVYWTKPHAKKVVPLGPFFYPLDSIGAYHRIYGPGGMIQWQALVPSREAVREIFAATVRMGGSFLTVLKVMGDHPSAGLLSFSGAGVTLALDFPYSQSVLEKLPYLDEIVASAGGRLYPAKDARMSGPHFRRFFPQWEQLVPYIDPRFSSSFWRRVTG
jgi:FAD/FMN-containing dehydrogenase